MEWTGEPLTAMNEKLGDAVTDRVVRVALVGAELVLAVDADR